ncbi:type II toxin-antitoxin system RelE/ParE family toxin [Bradyrhizobium manausense]|uniref:Plasmid stabilization protein n=1 Tax=Bradyrhizobium manausense TaxID=989370 RepID=A0A0R3E682_9BRAD|nr:type II toxin-antitoxin system RelE/ParE family toxin [Bradyrhizobium manausense]KRQ17651.1 plasmid stabilization protein [Bradyrhizobium manausense]
MAKRPLKSPQTEIDLTAIWDYIAADNPRAADALLDRIDATFNMLAGTPFAGRDRSELRAELRSFQVGNYLIFYIPTADGVEVVRVMHGRQDIGADDMQ